MRIWKNKKLILYIVFCITPLLAGLLLSIISGTSIFSLDAWNTIWSDERIYYRAVQTIRTQGLATGVQSYNEVASMYPAWGAYNVLTYIPYVLASFLTGITSHNFVYYGNVILAIITNIAFVAILKPSVKKIGWLIAFSLTFLIYQRYVWSGMSEVSSVLMLVITLACAIKLYDEGLDKKYRGILILTLVFMSWFFGIIRPFLFVTLLIPVVYIFITDYTKKRKVVYSIAIVAGTILALIIYLEMRKSCAIYFSGTNVMDTLGGYILLLKNGEILEFIIAVLYTNYLALKSILSQMFNVVGLMSLVFAVTTLILFYLLLVEKEWKKKLLVGIFIFMDVVIVEAIILLYSSAQLHRMLLGVVVANCYLICLSEKRAIKGIQQIVIGLVLLCMIVNRPDFFRLPQETNQIDEVAVKEEYLEIMPYDESDAWGNTIAHVSESSNPFLGFCFPNYMNTSSCREDYLEKAIATDALKSKYLYLREDHYLTPLCKSKYEQIWNEYGYCIYVNNNMKKGMP